MHLGIFKSLLNASNEHWSFISARGHPDGKHICYGTNSSTEASSQISIGVRGAQCNGGLCKLKIQYLHSWDTTYIAHSICELYTVDSNTNHLMKLVDSVSIVPNKCGRHHSIDVTGTYMCSHILHVKKVLNEDQQFSIQCKSKELGKLACIGEVELFVSESKNEEDRRTLVTNQDNREFYDPTSVELEQGTAFAAPKYWGVHIRRDKSLRVAFIGGSQTSSDSFYVNNFRDSIKKLSANLGWNIAVYNEGFNGTSPSTLN